MQKISGNTVDTVEAAENNAFGSAEKVSSSEAKKASKTKKTSENGKTAKKTALSSSAKSKKTVKKRPQAEEEIFALDIGTRNVVGIIGKMDENGVFNVISAYTTPHKQRAMIDGQIEDIKEVARIVRIVKEKLEEKTGIQLLRVSIAAAGRALKTKHSEMEFDIEEKDVITEDAVKSFEVETVFQAQNELDEEIKDSNVVFYCVGHTVVNYYLDDYKIKSLTGHKGKKVKIDLIAAFLPGIVVESLYSVMDLNNLEVSSLTLEPIAAMNVIIPPEVRLINVALVDIGAGTSDIAVSQNGSIVAYAMSTVAGDEITEEIIRKYIVDFETAEEMKLSGYKEEIEYKDILGFDHTIPAADFYSSLFPAVGSLAEDISANILKANGQAPAAVFLIGGGSQIPDLAKIVAEKLEMPESRVAVGGRNPLKHISIGNTGISGPEFVTPIGIGVTSVVNKGYDFSVVTLNNQKMRVFDTRAVSVVDLLMLAGFKTNQIIGRSGRSLTFTLNGEKQIMKGELAIPGQIILNNMPASLEATVKQGDNVEFTPAISGMNAAVNISDIAGDVSSQKVFVDGEEYTIGVTAIVNGKAVSGDYQIQNFDVVTINEIDTLGDLMRFLPFDADSVSFYKGGKRLTFDYYLRDNDDILTGEKVSGEEGKLAKEFAAEKTSFDFSIPLDAPAKEETVQPEVTEQKTDVPEDDVLNQEAETETISSEPDAVQVQSEEKTEEPSEEKAEESAEEEVSESPAEFRVILNGKSTSLPQKSGNEVHQFIELMAIADIDLDNPSPSGNMITTINGRTASFMDEVKYGDNIVIKWADN